MKNKLTALQQNNLKGIDAATRQKVIEFLRQKYSNESNQVIIDGINQITGRKLCWCQVQNLARNRKIKRKVLEKGDQLIPIFIWKPELENALIEKWKSGLSKKELITYFLKKFDFAETEDNKEYCWKALIDKSYRLNKQQASNKSNLKNLGNGRKKLSNEEELLLSLFYPTADDRTLQTVFYNRKWSSILWLGSERKLNRPKSWTDKHEEILQKHYATKGAVAVAKMTGKTANNIRALANKRGLSVNPKTITNSRQLSKKESNLIKQLYPAATLYELYFNLPGRTFYTISNHATKRLGLQKRLYVDQPLNGTPKKIRWAMIRACRETSKLIKKRYTRLPYPELVKTYSEDQRKKITASLESLLTEYFQQTKLLAKKHIVFRERDGMAANDAIEEFAQEAFYAAFEFIINWTHDDFLEIVEYYMQNKNKLRRNGYGITKSNFIDYRNLSISGVKNLDGDNLPEDLLLPAEQAKFYENLDQVEISRVMYQALPKSHIKLIHQAALGSLDFSKQDSVSKYGEALCALTMDPKFQAVAEDNNVNPELLARIIFMMIKN